MNLLAIGIDIGGTNTKIGIVDQQGEMLLQKSIPTNIENGFDDFVQVIYQKVNEWLQPFIGEYELAGLGIGVPGANPYNGTIAFASNLGYQTDLNLVAIFEHYFNKPAFLDNDANAAALGEMYYGGAKDISNFLLITLGTGIGCGIVSNGQLVQGAHGLAGELGHMVVNPNGRFCLCGRRGCLETYASATGIKRTIYKLLADYVVPSELRKVPFDDLTAKMITEAALRGDQIAQEAFKYTAQILGIKLADVIMQTDPEAVFFFGGLTKAGDLLFEPLSIQVEKNVLESFKGKAKILPSALLDKNIAVLGASALVWQNLQHDNFHNLQES